MSTANTLRELESALAQATWLRDGPYGTDADVQRIAQIGRRIQELKERAA